VRSGTPALATWLLLAFIDGHAGQAAPRPAVLTTARFAFFSDFETNLNDALTAAGLARKKSGQELFRAGAEAACFGALPPSRRAAWNAAVDYYAQIVSPVSFAAREQFSTRMQLAGFGENPADAADAELVATSRSFRSVAGPAYRACRWDAQDVQNRQWIAELQPRLAAHEEALAARLEALYQKGWKTLPILVDVVETVDWSGANTGWSDAGQGHVLISSTVHGAAAFETVFHEASHVLMDRRDPVRRALDEAAQAAGVRLPGDLWHVVLFYTTGEVVRRGLAERGEPGYTPMLYEIYERGTWAEYRAVLEQHWGPCVDGKRSLAEAAASLVSALPTPAENP
jgi:hypothetical protein